MRRHRAVEGSWGLGLAGGLVLAALALGRPVCAEPSSYELDPEHTTVAFLVSHVGFAKVLGSFSDVEGSFRFDEETGELSDVSVRVKTASVATNHDDRDDHLRSGDFLDSRKYPVMTFTAAGALRTGEQTFAVDGELALRGQSHPLQLEATWNKSGDYPFGNAYAIGVSARGSFLRSAYGMSYGVDNGWVGDEVEIIVEFEAQRR